MSDDHDHQAEADAEAARQFTGQLFPPDPEANLADVFDTPQCSICGAESEADICERCENEDIAQVEDVTGDEPTEPTQTASALEVANDQEAGALLDAALGPMVDNFVLTGENYHSKEANERFMSHSQYGKWLECAACQYALQQGEFKQEESNALFGGRYGHVNLLEPHLIEAFAKQHPELFYTESQVKQIQAGAGVELFYTTTELKEVAAAEGIDLKGAANSKTNIIARMAENGFTPPDKPREFVSEYKWLSTALPAFRAQEQLSKLIKRGSHEVIIEFMLGGVPWKAMIDNLRLDDKQFDDIKFMANFDDKWSKKHRSYVFWFEVWNYDRQMALYREATFQAFGTAFRPNITAVSKQDPADVDWVQFRDGEYLDRLVADMEANMAMILEWKNGETEAPRCEQSSCLYCRSTKVLNRPRIAVAR